MIDLPQMKTRMARLEELERGLAKEVGIWQGRDSLLLPVERRQYLNAIQTAIAGLDDARDLLNKAVARLEQVRRQRNDERK